MPPSLILLALALAPARATRRVVDRAGVLTALTLKPHLHSVDPQFECRVVS